MGERQARVFFLKLDDEAKAVKLAREIVAKTGHVVGGRTLVNIDQSAKS
jgi:hypothetical protein